MPPWWGFVFKAFNLSFSKKVNPDFFLE